MFSACYWYFVGQPRVSYDGGERNWRSSAITCDLKWTPGSDHLVLARVSYDGAARA